MADSFFGFDTSASNLNDEDGGGGDCSEEEYDALNDETFGHEGHGFDWEFEHEQLAEQLESSRRHNSSMDDSHTQLEASLSQLVLDEIDTPSNSAFNTSNVWKHDGSLPLGSNPVKALKNVCTVEELERQLRQKQSLPAPNQNYFQPRFPVILQRPPGLQAPVPLPFAPQNQMTNIQQNMSTLMNQNQMQMPNQMTPNQMGPSNQIGPIRSQMGPIGNQMGQMNNQIGQVGNQMGQVGNQMGQVGNQMGQIGNQMMQNHQNQFMQNKIMPNVNMGQGNMLNQMAPNGNQFGPNQFQQMMSNPRMMAPPPGLNMPQRPNFNNVGQFNSNFRGPTPMEQPNLNQNPMINQLMPPQMKPQIINQNQMNAQNNQKVQQKTIYNNQNNQKNMTSENLVQYIQNTHPMLQIQNSYHNASHHPMLNNRTFNNTNMMNNNAFNNQRNSFSDNRQLPNGIELQMNGETDEYAGLMTNREKQWLINIQMLQLNTGTPYIDDFYYTVFLERQSKKEKESVKEAHKANRQNHPFFSGAVKQETHRERHNSNRHNSLSEEPVQPRNYVPTQFENSLGKLQCGSVTAPRKIIDLEVVQNEVSSSRASRAPSAASITNPNEVPRELRRTKQVLLDIEALYLILLRLEELNDPLAISNALILKEREEKQKQLEISQKQMEDDGNLFLKNIESVQRRPNTDSPRTELVDKRQVVNLTVNPNPSMTAKNLLDENKDDLMNKMFIGLLHEDRLQQFMMVRKGKSLLSRFLVRVPACHSRLRALWCRILRSLSSAARRDDGSLASLASPFKLYIQHSSGWSAVLESCSILAEALDPARTHYVLTSTLTLSCICTLLEKASTLVNTPEATSNERQWMKFLKTFARASKNTNLTIARPIQPLSDLKVTYHIKQLESRSIIEILQRGKTVEFSDLSKTEFSEQLLKNLC